MHYLQFSVYMGSNRTEPNRSEKIKNRTEPNRNRYIFEKLQTEPIGSVRFGSVPKPNRSQHWSKHVVLNRTLEHACVSLFLFIKKEPLYLNVAITIISVLPTDIVRWKSKLKEVLRVTVWGVLFSISIWKEFYLLFFAYLSSYKYLYNLDDTPVKKPTHSKISSSIKSEEHFIYLCYE
jgi:hypothetical protein